MGDSAKKVYADNPQASRSPYFPVPMSQFEYLEGLDIPLFIKMSDQFVEYVSSSDSNREELFAHLREKKVQTVYVHLRHREALFQKTEKYLHKIISDEKLDVQVKCTALHNAAMSLVDDLYQNPESTERLKSTKNLVENQINLIQQHPKAFTFLSTLGAHDYYTYTHTIGVATYTIALLIAEQRHSDQYLLEAGQGALLHDIGKAKIPWEIINKHSALSEEEWAKMKQHPEIGHAILQRAGFTSEIILQATRNHHENLDGTGYPDKLKGDQIHWVTQVVGISDVLNALTTNRSYSNARTTFEAFTFIKEHMSNKFSPELFKKFLVMFRE
jgi:putative nucleotidyltransferase with HDIG domain